MLDALPAELKACPQWIVWEARYNEQRGKLDKIPLSAVTGYPCDVTKTTSWATYEQACASFQAYASSHRLGGVGFVLGYNSGVVGVDLDGVLHSDGSCASTFHRDFANQLNSYTELSPSGTGLHVLVRAEFAGGRRMQGVEVYGQGRFFTMTGKPYGAPRPVNTQQEYINTIIAQIDAARAKNGPTAIDWHAPERMADDALYHMARYADNGEKFLDLWQGRWVQHYSSQSEADFALVNILGFYSDAPTQIARLFHMSALGQREKAYRHDYLSQLLSRSQDRKIPLVPIPDAPQVEPQPVIDAEPVLDEHDAEVAYARGDDAFQPPEGFVRTLAEWFLAQAPYPIKELATCAALTLMAGIVGRQYQFQKSGLNLYMMLLAETGAGKDALGMGVSRIFDAICVAPIDYNSSVSGVELGFPAARHFQGPAELTGKGLLRAFADSNTLSMVSVLPEFSQTMTAMSAPNANEGLRAFMKMLLDFYTRSAEGAAFTGTKNADSSKDIKPIISPAFTMVCEGTPGRFYSALTETMITDGLLSRFIIIEKIGYTEFNPHYTQFATPPEEIKEGVKALCTQVLTLRQNGDLRIHVQMQPDAEQYSERLRAYYRERGIAGSSEVQKFLWMRAHQNLCRMAALVAIGCSPYQPTVTVAHLQWANRIIYRQVMLIIDKFKRGETGKAENDETDQYQCVLTALDTWRRLDVIPKHWRNVRYWKDAHAAGLVPYAYLQQRTAGYAAFRHDRRGHTQALRTVIQGMESAGTLTLTRFGDSPGKFYKISL